ncbi:SPOR domain-containing protein [Desulfovibrio desulfuricans]|uniref:SPOR domain-containing protein n=1 Tax=Desulfovibrio desulfuricans TaxID=876 RepID=UPI001F2104C9|nr:SPOR domain-containing protein [Desulfovibrio desulfuricans]UIB01137.1 SPOR domain-containing protein [Desulfovibrio desulfuricans]
MAAPLRKPRKSVVSQPSGEKRRFVIRLSGPMLALLGAILVVAVGWSFFMGFMVGRGQNPETRVEQMTSMISKDAPKAKPAPEAPAPDAAAPAAQAETADAQNPAPGAEENQAMPAGAPQPGKPGQDQKGQKAAAQAPQGKQGQQPPQGAYPFAQPSGNSLAAWGIKPGANQNAQGQGAQASAQTGAQANAQNGVQAAKPAPAKTGPQFDYVYQVAAFKSDEDADKLRTRLEGKGLRTRTQKNGKLVLVMVSIRGTEDDAFNLREDLRHMKLGVPIQISQKPVSSKPQKSGR